MEFRNVERTTGDAVTAADTIVLLKIDDAVFVLDDRAVRGTRSQATGIFAVHALVLAHQPHQIAIVLILRKLDQVVVVPLGRRHRLIRVVESGLAKWVIVPFDTGNFAGFATDAGGDVDILADFFGALCSLPRHRSGMGRDFLDLKCLWISYNNLRM